MLELKHVLLGVAVLGLVGCETTVPIHEGTIQHELEPMPEPQRVAGRMTPLVRNGAKGWTAIAALDGGLVHYETDQDCIYMSRGEFWPATQWNGCKPFADGTQEVELIGDIYPLVVGKKWRFESEGKNANGDSWNNTRKCEVVQQVALTIFSGDFDTYKVVCTQRNATRTYYMAPSVGQMVAFERKSKRDGNEYIEFDPASAT